MNFVEPCVIRGRPITMGEILLYIWRASPSPVRYDPLRLSSVFYIRRRAYLTQYIPLAALASLAGGASGRGKRSLMGT